MVKRWRETVYHKKKKKRNYRKKLKKYTKKTRRAVNTGVKIWRAVNTKANKKKAKSMSTRANKVAQNIMDII